MKSDDIKMSIHLPGHDPIEVTPELLDKATKQIKSGMGHNSENIVPGEIAQDRLKSLVQKIEKLNEDKDAVSDSIKDVYAEAKSTGLDSKIIRKIIAERRMDADKRREQADLMALYKAALHMEV